MRRIQRSYRRTVGRALLLVGLLSWCACSQITVETHVARRVNLSRYETYALLPRGGAGIQLAELPDYLRAPSDSSLQARIHAAVGAGLAQRGLRPVASLLEADLAIGYATRVADRIKDIPATMGDGPRGLPYHEKPADHDTTLVRWVHIDALDREARTVIWSGVATSPREDMLSGEGVEKMVARILEAFPPR